jgi:hypothetical protein
MPGSGSKLEHIAPSGRPGSSIRAEDVEELSLLAAPARVVAVNIRELILNGSPLTPSQPGHAGDQGMTKGVRITDVLREPHGLVHVIEEPVAAKPGDELMVEVDGKRRGRLERIHAALVLTRVELARRGVEVVSVDVAAGLAWLEIRGRAGPIDLQPAVAAELPLECHRSMRGGMLVACDHALVTTVDAPIARTSGAAEGAEVREVGSPEDDVTTLEIALPDARGQWWR